MKRTAQIGQCRIYVDETGNNEFYMSQPLISSNCQCENCKYFEENVVKRNIRLFKNLKAMGVILERQPNINPDGVSCVGDTEKFERGYLGNYKVLGQFRKTQKEPQIKDEFGNIKSVRFEEVNDEYYCSYEIIRISDNELDFQFWIEVDRIK